MSEHREAFITIIYRTKGLYKILKIITIFKSMTKQFYEHNLNSNYLNLKTFSNYLAYVYVRDKKLKRLSNLLGTPCIFCKKWQLIVSIKENSFTIMIIDK